VHFLSLSRTLSSVSHLSCERTERAPEGSFIAETSFAKAPLNTRLPPVSPHRAAVKSRKSRSSRGEEPAARRSNGAAPTGDEDELSDSGSLIEEQEEDEETKERREQLRRKAKGLEKEPLEGLSADLQEALMVEDLLFVLMVSRERFRVSSRQGLTFRTLQGIEGRYIEYDPSYTPEDDFERMQGAQFVVDQGLGPSLKALSQKSKLADLTLRAIVRSLGRLGRRAIPSTGYLLYFDHCVRRTVFGTRARSYQSRSLRRDPRNVTSTSISS